MKVWIVLKFGTRGNCELHALKVFKNEEKAQTYIDNQNAYYLRTLFF